MATSTDLRAAIEEVQEQLPDSSQEGELSELGYRSDLFTRFERRAGALPWWVISTVVHSVIFLLATLLTVALPPAEEDEVVITSDVARKEEPKYDEKKKRDIFKNPQEVKAETEVENPVVVHEQTEVTDHFETDNNMDSQSARGSEDAISDIPLGGTGVTGSMGVGGGGMAGCFGYRDEGGRKRAVKRFGGSAATESAVEAALRWLARHQEKGGNWDSKKYGSKWRYDVGMTGLAMLAFLGAGYTHKSGRFRDNVRRAQAWLMKQQKDDGDIGGHGYLHSIAGLALAEAYGMTKDEALRVAAQKAVDYSTKIHQVPYSGWRYKAKQAGDLSVSGWFVMQLKSARVAGLKVDGAAFQGAQNFVEKCTSVDGWAGYTGKCRYCHSTTAVGMLCRQFLGARNTNGILKKAAVHLTASVPEWNADEKGVGGRKVNPRKTTFYYWYYGTLAMFQMGGDNWKSWNVGLKKALLPNQRKGGPLDGSLNDVDGSWDMLGALDKKGGRVYTTALGALCLEVYYRYLPMYAK